MGRFRLVAASPARFLIGMVRATFARGAMIKERLWPPRTIS